MNSWWRIVFFPGIVFYSFSQDVHFSQVDAMGIYINPAATGFFNGSFRASALHRQQWTGMGKGFVTSYGSLEVPIFSARDRVNKGGVGGFFYSDVSGDSRFKTDQASISASGIVRLSDNHSLSGGLQVSYVQRSFNMEGIRWVNQYNGLTYDASISSNEIITNSNTRFVDLGAGIRYEFSNLGKSFRLRPYQHLSLNAALFHPTEPFLSYLPLTEEKLKTRWVGAFNYIHDIRGTSFGLNLFGLYMKQGPFEQWLGTLMVRYRLKKYESQLTGLINQSVISAGFIYRNTGFVIPTLRIKLSNLEFGMCYDAFIPVIRTHPKGMNGFEIQLTYTKSRSPVVRVKK